jgi:16S rRNA (adenine1518-N6/adenine1519-N6)-dimethyltransferase
MNPTGSNEHPREALRRRGLSPKKRLGQNFIISRKTLERIVEAANVCDSDVVLEVGTGHGEMTALLAQRARAVIGVEIDRGLYEAASERLAGLDNVRLIHGDFLAGKHRINAVVTEAVRQAAGRRPVKVVSNLPYQISSPAVLNLLEWEAPVGEMYVMLQREVMDRFTASPGSADYGPSTVVGAYWAEVEVLFNLPPSAFWPPPAVTSSFGCFRRRPPLVPARDYALFVEVVNRLFQNRRKTIGRTLEGAWGREAARAALESAGVRPTCRPEDLAPEQFVRLADALV